MKVGSQDIHKRRGKKKQAQADGTMGVATTGATNSKEKDVEVMLVNDTRVGHVAVVIVIIGTSKQEENRETQKGYE